MIANITHQVTMAALVYTPSKKKESVCFGLKHWELSNPLKMLPLTTTQQPGKHLLKGNANML